MLETAELDEDRNSVMTPDSHPALISSHISWLLFPFAAGWVKHKLSTKQLRSSKEGMMSMQKRKTKRRANKATLEKDANKSTLDVKEEDILNE